MCIRDRGGPYPGTVNIMAPATTGEVAGLTTGTPYYMVLTATNTSNRTSPATAEGSGIPLVFEGVTPPEIISDLQVIRSASFPDSIELHWSRPNTDIYGGPTTLSLIHI